MNPARYAVRLGMIRGWIQFRQLMTSPDGIANTLIWNGVPLGILILMRNGTFEGSPLPLATVAMPGILGFLVAGAAMGVAYYLSADREDGTLLRAKAVPNGMAGYMTGIVVVACLETALGLLLILVPGLFLFEGLASGDVLGWLTLLWVFVLGMLAVVPLGVVIGSVVKSPRAIGGMGLLVIGGLTFVSGIIWPLQSLWGWVQAVGQVLPTYWLGLGMRSALLPDEAVVAEIGESWRTLETVGVLGAWAVAGLVLAPILLRRMARRESGSSVEARRQEFMQRIG